MGSRDVADGGGDATIATDTASTTSTTTDASTTTELASETDDDDVAEEVEEVEADVLPPLDPQLDEDGDGVKNGVDGCARGETGWTSADAEDFDHDGCRDASEDGDDDEDGVADATDVCPTFDDRFTPFALDLSTIDQPLECPKCTSQRRIEYTDQRDARGVPVPPGPLPLNTQIEMNLPLRTDAALVTLIEGYYFEQEAVGWSTIQPYHGLMEPPIFRVWLTHVRSLGPQVRRTTLVYEDGVCDWAEQRFETQPIPMTRNLKFEAVAVDAEPPRELGSLHFAHGRANGPHDIDGDGEPDPWFDPLWDCGSSVLSGCDLSILEPEPIDWDSAGAEWGLGSGNPVYLSFQFNWHQMILVDWPMGQVPESQLAHLALHHRRNSNYPDVDGPHTVRLTIDDVLIYERTIDLPQGSFWYIGELIAPTNIVIPAGRCTASYTTCSSDADCTPGRTCDDYIFPYD